MSLLLTIRIFDGSTCLNSSKGRVTLNSSCLSKIIKNIRRGIIRMISLNDLKTFFYDKTGKKHVYTEHKLCYEYQMLRDNKLLNSDNYSHKVII